MPSPNSLRANSYYICAQCQQLAPNSLKQETVRTNGLLQIKYPLLVWMEKNAPTCASMKHKTSCSAELLWLLLKGTNGIGIYVSLSYYW